MLQPFYQLDTVTGITYVRLWDDDAPIGQQGFGPMCSGDTQAHALLNLQLALATIREKSGARLRSMAAFHAQIQAALVVVQHTRGIDPFPALEKATVSTKATGNPGRSKASSKVAGR